jgi:exo-beta-1,3-glucanase (GH17 family)
VKTPPNRRPKAPLPTPLVLVAALAALLATGGTAPVHAAPRQEPFVIRPLSLSHDGRWIGNGVAYGPHRDGQSPDGASPTREQLRQDLHLMAARWSLLRVYGAASFADTMLQVIRDDRIDMKVMLGVWIAPEETRDSTGRVLTRLPANQAANRREIEAAVRLAAAYPDLVRAVCAGNETQVSWSAHRVPANLLVGTIRELRMRTNVPVTTADDFAFWKSPESQAVAAEIDFVTAHMHPLWNGILLPDALDWTRRTYGDVRVAHPGRLVVLGETGWATARSNEGDQGKLMKGAVGEAEQKVFHDALTSWVTRERVPVFEFEAFDENWKGGSNPRDVEKHWGLFRADRTPKPAVGGKGRP